MDNQPKKAEIAGLAEYKQFCLIIAPLLMRAEGWREISAAHEAVESGAPDTPAS